MDPLSCAASVLAVIQLTGSLVGICGGYIAKVKNAKKDIYDLQQEISGLEEVLEMLNQLLRGPDRKKLTTIQEVKENVAKCSSVLEDLKDKIDTTTQSPARKLGIRTLKWPLKRAEVEEAIARVAQYKSLFILALQIDQVKSSDRIEQKLDLDKLKIAEGAAFDSYDNQHTECFPGTRGELLDRIKHWAESVDGKCISWLNGKAGTGKSTIATTIARHFRGEKLLGGSFFFKRGEKDRGTARRLFPTLIQHLVIYFPYLAHAVQKTVDDDPHISDKALGEQFDKLLLKPLCSVELAKSVPIIIVIDAMDECESEEDRDLRTLIHLLPQVQKARSLQLRFFLTSRPELPVRLGFKAITGNYQDFVLHEIPQPEIQRDISLVLEHRLSKIQQERSLPINWPKKSDIQTLITMSVPLFIFAITICRILEDDQWDPEESLRHILRHQMDHSQLDRTYLPALNRLLMNQVGARKEHLVKEYCEVLGTIIMLETPLSILSLSNLTKIRKESIRLRLNSLHSVLNIPTNDITPVRLFHLSFRDFLLDPETRAKSPIWIDAKEMHQNLTLQCITLMEHSLRKNICNLSRDTTSRKEIVNDDINKNIPPELQYACQYWAHHLLQCPDPALQLVKASSFLKMHLLHWLEVTSILGRIFEVSGVIQKLQSVIEINKNVEISEFLQDVQWFVLNNKHIADIAPLQLYSSALIFTPTNSIVRNLFRKDVPSWMHRLPKVEETWNVNIHTLEGHSNPVRSVAFSPDGQTLASGSDDKTIKLWDPATGQLLHTIEGHSSYISSIAFSPDGQSLASGSFDKSIKLWDSTTGRLQHILEGHSDVVYSIAFSPDGQTLASSSRDKSIKQWDPTTGQLLRIIEGHFMFILSITFSPDGQTLVSGSDDKAIKLWDPTTGHLQHTLEGHSNTVRSVAFSPDGQLLASSSDDKSINIWDPTTGQLLRTIEGHSNYVESITFSPDGQTLASSSNDKIIHLWDPATGQLLHTIEAHSIVILSIAFSPDGRFLASGSFDKTIKLWDPTTRQIQHPVESHSSAVYSITFSPDGQTLASGSDDETIKLWDPTTGRLLRTIEGHSNMVYSIAFSPGGQTLVSGSGDKAIKLWNPTTGQLQYTLEGHSEAVRSVVFSPDGQTLASGSDDKTIKLWDPATGQLLQNIEGHSSYIFSIAFSPDGQFLASGSFDKSIKLWDPTTGQLQYTLEGHSNPVRSVVFSPDGQTLASSSFDQTINLWDPATGQLEHTLGGHSDLIWAEHNVNISILESQWLCFHNEKTLWLPVEYRPSCLAITGSTLALGHASGRISYMSCHV